jgi:hypothetical protein
MNLRTRILAGGAALATLAVPIALDAPAAGASTPVTHPATTMVQHPATKKPATSKKRDEVERHDETERHVPAKKRVVTRRVRREVFVTTFATRKAALAELARLRRDGIRGFDVHRIRVHGRFRYRIEERGLEPRTAAAKVRALRTHHLPAHEVTDAVA